MAEQTTHARPGVLPERYLTPEDLVTILQLPSVQTVYRWRKTGTGPVGFRVGKHLRYDPASVRQWVTEQTQQAA